MKQKLISIVIPYRFVDDYFEVWMQVRKSNDELNGMLEFPGGKQEFNETSAEAAVREFNEEVGVKYKASELKLYTIYSNKLSDKIVNLSIYLKEETPDGPLGVKGWHKLACDEDLRKIESQVPPANRIFLKEFIIKSDFNKLKKN